MPNFLASVGRSGALPKAIESISNVTSDIQNRAVQRENLEMSQATHAQLMKESKIREASANIDLAQKQRTEQRMAAPLPVNAAVKRFAPNATPTVLNNMMQEMKDGGLIKTTGGVDWTTEEDIKAYAESKKGDFAFMENMTKNTLTDLQSGINQASEVMNNPKAKPEEIQAAQAQIDQLNKRISDTLLMQTHTDVQKAYHEGKITEESWQKYQQTGNPRDVVVKETVGDKTGAVESAAMKIMADNPGTTFTEAYQIAKQGVGAGRVYEGGQVRTLEGASEAAGELKYGEKAGEQKAIVEQAQNIEFEKGRGETKAKFEAAFPKIKNTMTSLNRQWDLVDTYVDEAIDAISPYTAGIGSWVKVIPGTPQRTLAKRLETIQANMGFDKLQQMRADSPTGGALGPVSDFENRLLQAVKGSLEQEQSPAELMKNLIRIKADLQNIRQDRNAAFKMDYGDMLKENENPRQGKLTPEQEARRQELLKKAGK